MAFKYMKCDESSPFIALNEIKLYLSPFLVWPEMTDFLKAFRRLNSRLLLKVKIFANAQSNLVAAFELRLSIRGFMRGIVSYLHGLS